MQKWADQEVDWIKLDIPVGLSLLIADKDCIKDWWYREGCHAEEEITAEEERAMALEDIDLDETQG